MNEKEIIKSKFAYAKEMGILTFFIFFIAVIVLYIILSLAIVYDRWSLTLFVKSFAYFPVPAIIILSIGILLAIIVSKFKSELTITDKRVYGMGIFGKRVDLPLDSISAISSIPIFKGNSISTSSGNIKFFGLNNYKEIHEIISKLLFERQEQKKEETPYQVIQNQSNADELKKYKELLDSGVITQEEFDSKKKQLLGS